MSPRWSAPRLDQQWDVLEWELKSFVCEGEYARGLERILNSFLTNLNQPQQPAVWVSGFYGSGKSHLVRVLEYLWRDIEMPGGKHAPDLVTLPDEIRGPSDGALDSWQASRWAVVSGRHAGSGEERRGSACLPLSALRERRLAGAVPLARFMIWAHENGYLDAVRLRRSRRRASRLDEGDPRPLRLACHR